MWYLGSFKNSLEKNSSDLFFETLPKTLDKFVSWNGGTVSFKELDAKAKPFLASVLFYSKAIQYYASIVTRKRIVLKQNGIFAWNINFLRVKIETSLHKKWSFPLNIYSVNVTKSAGNRGIGHYYWRNL